MRQFETIAAGTEVRVVESLGEVERELIGRTFVFCRWDHTHGHAVVTDDKHHWHLHPEALEVVR